MKRTQNDTRSHRSILPLATDLIFVCIAAYQALNYGRVMLSESQTPLLLIRDAFFLAYLLIALILLVVRNKAESFTANKIEYAYAIIGFSTPLLFQLEPSGSPFLVGASLEVIGLLLVVGAFLSLNRSFGLAPENRGVKTKGAYRCVRHPMYLGYILAEGGFVLDNFSYYNLVTFGVSVLFLLLRLRAEEKLLLQDRDYRQYAKATRWKLVPGIY